MKKVILIFTIGLVFLNPLLAEKITFSANSMTGKAGDTNTATNLSGNAYVKTETMEISADNLELFGEDYQNIKASGNVSGKNLETHMDFTCDLCRSRTGRQRTGQRKSNIYKTAGERNTALSPE